MKLPLSAACGLILSSVAPMPGAEPGPARQQELLHLVRQDCGSCHGMRLTGGLGLPLTPEALRDKPVEGLEATVYYGRPGTAMPPWKSILSEAEVHWIVQKLMTGFPNE
jgi:cytochrome c55X